MGFELGKKESYWSLLATPGPIITIAGLIILALSAFFFSAATPEAHDINAMIDAQMETNHGRRLTSMIGLVIGTVVSIAGVLWSFIAFSRS